MNDPSTARPSSPSAGIARRVSARLKHNSAELAVAASLTGLCLGVAALATAAGASETIAYTYDARGRLVQVKHSGTVNNGVTTNYALDKADNRTGKTTIQ